MLTVGMAVRNVICECEGILKQKGLSDSWLVLISKKGNYTTCPDIGTTRIDWSHNLKEIVPVVGGISGDITLKQEEYLNAIYTDASISCICENLWAGCQCGAIERERASARSGDDGRLK